MTALAAVLGFFPRDYFFFPEKNIGGPRFCVSGTEVVYYRLGKGQSVKYRLARI